jgi:hypothetical protein
VESQLTEISLEFLAEQQRCILDEVQKMRGEMQTARRDMQFISGDYRLIRHDLTGASLRFDAAEPKGQPMAEITMEFIAKQLERVISEQGALRDEMLVLGARMSKVEAGVAVIATEVHAIARPRTANSSWSVRP